MTACSQCRAEQRSLRLGSTEAIESHPVHSPITMPYLQRGRGHKQRVGNIGRSMRGLLTGWFRVLHPALLHAFRYAFHYYVYLNLPPLADAAALRG